MRMACALHALQVCRRTSDDSVWQPGDPHCASCAVECLSPPSPPLAPGGTALPDDAFCTGPGTDMHMSGFAFVGTDCIILLFRGDILGSISKKVIACRRVNVMSIISRENKLPVDLWCQNTGPQGSKIVLFFSHRACHIGLSLIIANCGGRSLST